MTDRIPLDDLTSDQLDALYDRLEDDEKVITHLEDQEKRLLRAEAELKRLRAGEEDGYDPRCLPTPGQWIKNYNNATAESRQAIVTRLTGAATQGHNCAMGLHEERLREGREEAAIVGRVRALWNTWLRMTLEPGQVRRLLDEVGRALDSDGAEQQLAEQRAEQLATALRETLDCIAFGLGQPNPGDYDRWRAVLDQPKEQPDA